VAIAVLGLGMTVVLSAQTGVFLSYSRATHLSQAPGLVRCKMEEIELRMLTEGYPLLDEKDEGECCEDLGDDRYSCSWEILRVQLPDMMQDGDFDGDAGAGAIRGEGEGEGEATSSDSDESAVGSSAGGPLSALMSFQQSGGSMPGGEQASIGGLASMMASSDEQSGGGLASTVMSLVYPDLKPMLEGSIRKVNVSAHWMEGKFERELTVTQFVTNPQQGGFNPMDQAVLDAMEDQIDSLDTPSSGAMQPGGKTQ
jgi:general secretion pathway protein I